MSGSRQMLVPVGDGRQVGVAEFGDPQGVPVFYFHGHPGSRWDWLMADPDRLAVAAGVRVLAVDRPGYGLSTPDPQRVLGDWPKVVEGVADELGVSRFAVVGYSGGGPFAFAVCAGLPQRVTVGVTVAGMGPSVAPGQKRIPGWAYSMAPGRLRVAMLRGTAAASRRTPQSLAAAVMRASLPAPDRRALGDPRVVEALMATWKEAFRAGISGALRDAVIYTEPWLFDPAAIQVPMRAWHGDRDVNVPVSVGRYLAAQTPSMQYHELPNQGHVSIWAACLPAVLTEVATAARVRG